MSRRRDVPYRARSRRAERLMLATGVLAVACISAGPTLNPALAGCYRVIADGWTSSHARVTGLDALPPVIALDTSYMGRVLAPASWSVADPRNRRFVGLSLESYPMVYTRDSIYFDRLSNRRPLGNDSIVVSFQGWGGSLVAYLAREGNGFSGSAVVTPRNLDSHATQIVLRLRPAGCPADLR